MSTDNHTTTVISRNTARDRIKLVIKEALAEVGLQYAGLVSTHFLTPGFMLFQILIDKPADVGIHAAATLIFHAFSQDITLQSIGLQAANYYVINLKVDVQAALADVPTNEAA